MEKQCEKRVTRRSIARTFSSSSLLLLLSLSCLTSRHLSPSPHPFPFYPSSSPSPTIIFFNPYDSPLCRSHHTHINCVIPIPFLLSLLSGKERQTLGTSSISPDIPVAFSLDAFCPGVFISFMYTSSGVRHNDLSLSFYCSYTCSDRKEEEEGECER